MAKNMAKRNFIVSLTSLGLSAAMMVGTTFAWFTDTATSGGNIIQTGKLDVKMSYSKTLGGEYLDVEAENTPPVFNYTNWEPGYSDVKYVKIENEGSLAFQYSLDIVPMMLMADGEVDLADVIDVSVAVADGTATNMGTLSEIFDNSTSIADGVLYSDTVAENDTTKTDEIIYRITMKMKTSAGREYMGLNVGDGFDLRLYATQYTYENDSFDAQYDKDADFEKLPVAKVYKLTPPTVTNVDGESKVLNTAYEFKAPETYEEAQKSPYRYYHADFVVTFDQDVAEGSLGLAGYYETYSSEWLAFNIPEDIEANAPVRLLGYVGISMNYEEICLLVKEFGCGAYNNSLANVGKTMTVELRLYETEEPSAENGNSTNVETGNYEVIGKYSYTFEGEDGVTNPTAIVHKATSAELAEVNNGTIISYNAPSDFTGTVQLESAYTFTATDTAETLANNPYAKWTVDYVVSIDRTVAANSLGLAGGYGAWKDGTWFAIFAPEEVPGNVEIPLFGWAGFNRWTYEDICTGVTEFKCGVFNLSPDNSGKTITVELRLYNPENENDYMTVNKTKYTFQ